MKKQKHTLGPWKENKSNNGDIYSTVANNDSGDPVMVARSHGPDGLWDKVCEEHKANACLIAAAPELLEALKNLKEAVESTTKGKYRPEILDALDGAQSIIDLVEKGK